ncbi:MAG: uracil-DNA glycosylase [bacterium]
MGNAVEIVRALREHLLYLIESDLEDVCFGVPRSAPDAADPEAGAGTELPGVDPESRLRALREELGECRRCSLAKGRRAIVFGEGDPRAEVLFIGEGPGSEEDATGRPFVGPAGEKLTEIIEKGMGIPRSRVFICNIVKCRPPHNRVPLDEEADACFPFLERQIEAVRPKVIVTLGHSATCRLLGVRLPMHQLRGRWHSYKDIPVMPTFHPSYVLRYYTVSVRKQVWEDVREVKRMLMEGKRRPPAREPEA